MIVTLIGNVNENNYHLIIDDLNACASCRTLALMTHFAESRCPRGGRAYSPMSGVPWEFRAALAKLGAG